MLTRPTLKAMGLLPRDSFADSVMYDRVRKLKGAAKGSDPASRTTFAELLKSISFLHISHPLLSDSDSFFTQGKRPDKHRDSLLQGHTVYEVRDRSGAAWRGAVISLRDSGNTTPVPWLVYAAAHDHFHAEARSFFKGSKDKALPQKLDWLIYNRDQDRKKLALEQQKSLEGFLAVLALALSTPSTIVSDTIMVRGTQVEVSLCVSPADEPDIVPDQAHEVYCDTTLSLRVRASSQQARDDIRRHWVHPLQSHTDLVETVYSRGDADSLAFELFVSYSRLAQLLTKIRNEKLRLTDVQVPQQEFAHYTAKAKLTESIVTGKAVQSLCGAFFVPTRDGEAGSLPICQECERREPLAQEVINLLLIRVRG